MTIIDHSYYRNRAQARRFDWIQRKCAFARTGITPPLQWADPQHDEKQGIRDAMAVLLAPIKGRS